MSASPRLPWELIERVINHSDDDRRTVRSCSRQSNPRHTTDITVAKVCSFIRKRTIMGGCLFLAPVRTNFDEEDVETGELNTSPEEADSNSSRYSSNSAFGIPKALFFQAAINYFGSLQQQVDQRKAAGVVTGSREHSSQASIIAAPTAPTDEQALADASTVIAAALPLLRSWDSDQVIYPSEARVIEESMGRVMDFLDEKWKEQPGQFRELLKRCGENETFVIQG
ncbi:hypothetical protein DICSQDRAFT_166059 [Dichomitus squalens LYAD-421 SS1]|uniref:Uncharacterized protein n=1 Tax=Dichomitus squalens TaxID=114155 RepID=A0A4Q9N549_9APHY|nr:uncharacterized protein DICSQDRAFT_166059 [Dichomitus squalens LYAD-421 SS1]EJF66365.1 hypothetical protein DICSQDRAFT_166059 [Dichomitus squalens LYAD-421 SS1]TBU35365.1 hypothetical protein BD311DRAFT_812753 [Dichomitus squalens]